MTWEEIDRLIALSKGDEPSPDLLARQINSNSNPAPYYMFIRRLAMEAEDPGVFLEIGSYYGCVAAHITSVGTNLLHLGIDINPVPYSHPNSIMILGDSVDSDKSAPSTVDMVRRIAEKCGGIAHVFQDSSHHYLPSVREWELYSPLVKPGGLWICDDITPAFRLPTEKKGMVEYFEDLPGEKRLFDDLHPGNAMGIIRMDTVNQKDRI